MCDAKVPYIVPKGWDYKTLYYKCGTTGIDGEAVLCAGCENKIAMGKMNRPGYCKHGTPLMDPTDHYDIYCPACEAE